MNTSNPVRNRHSLLLTALCALLLVFGCNNGSKSGDSAAQAEVPANQGTWKATSAVLGGTPFPPAITESITLKVTGDLYEVYLGDKPDKGTCVSDFSQTPHRMTITGTEGPNAGATLLAIFEMPGPDEMRVCYNMNGLEFPTSFASTKKNGLFLVQYTRKK